MNNTKPNLSFVQIFNMCFGFLGIQYAYALQNSSVSRIFQTLGAEMEELPILWAAAPLTGLIVQPIIGYLSDKTWTPFGRRRPFILLGAVLTTLSLFIFPHASALWFAASMLWILDSSINVANEPFRAYIGDSLPNKQRPLGFVTQSFFIGIGAVIASSFPYILTNVFDVSNTSAPGVIPDAVKYAFYFGGTVLILTVAWTVFTSKEYTPEQMAAFSVAKEKANAEERKQNISPGPINLVWLIGGVVAVALIYHFQLRQSLYILAGMCTTYGAMMYMVKFLESGSRVNNGFYHIMYDLNHMPLGMRQLAVVQFFSWFALFTMWIYITPAVTSYHFGSSDPTSKMFNDGADWVGVLSAIYNGFAALSAFMIPWLCRRFGIKGGHGICLVAGALGYAGVVFIKDPSYLWVAMIGVGIAWAAILALPYAMLSNVLPENKLGVYIGIFNFFITIPQLVAASLLGIAVKYLFDSQPIYAFFIGAVSLIIAALATIRVNLDND